MSFAPYRNYRDSGVKWLGEVPRGWDVRRIRHLFEIRKRICGADGHVVLSITQQGIKAKDIQSGDGQLSADYSKYQFVEVGDFAMNHMDLLTGYVDISSIFGVTSPDYRVFGVRDREVCFDKYYLYLFQAGYRNRIFYAFGQGSSQLGRWRFPSDQFNSFEFPCPPVEEQRYIAAFLDGETAKIDMLIGEQQRLIGLLREKRQGVIFHAVTKGLNPAAPMKDSGVEWLGKVPQTWEVKMLKWFATLQRGYDLTDLQREEGPYPVITSGGVNGFHSVYMVKGPGVVTGRYGSTGRLFYVQENFWPHNTSLFVQNFHGNDTRYVWYALQTLDFAAHSAKSAVPGIDRNDLHVIYVAVPPLREQSTIARCLDQETARMDALIAEAESANTLLQERRMAVIFAAITGKIDVRGIEVAQLRDEAAE